MYMPLSSGAGKRMASFTLAFAAAAENTPPTMPPKPTQKRAVPGVAKSQMAGTHDQKRCDAASTLFMPNLSTILPTRRAARRVPRSPRIVTAIIPPRRLFLKPRFSMKYSVASEPPRNRLKFQQAVNTSQGRKPRSLRGVSMPAIEPRAAAAAPAAAPGACRG